MPYVIPRALAASLFGSERAQHMQTFAYQDSGALRTDPIAVSTAETETVTAWLNRNGHQLTRGAGWPEAYLKVVPTDSALRGDAPATRPDATAPARIRDMTCLLPVELAARVIGSTLAGAVRRAELVDAGGVRHTVVSVTPGTRAHELLQAWRGRSGHICARPAAIELAADTCIVQQHGPIDLGDAPGVLHDSRRETPAAATSPTVPPHDTGAAAGGPPADNAARQVLLVPDALAERIFGVLVRRLERGVVQDNTGRRHPVAAVGPQHRLRDQLDAWRARHPHQLCTETQPPLGPNYGLILTPDIQLPVTPDVPAQDPLAGVDTVLLDHDLAERMLGAERASALTGYAYQDQRQLVHELPSIHRGGDGFDAVVRWLRAQHATLEPIPGCPPPVRRLRAQQPPAGGAPQGQGAQGAPTADAAAAGPRPIAEMPQARGDLADGLTGIDQAFDAVVGATLRNLRQQRAQVDARLRSAREQVIRQTRTLDALDRQIAGLSDSNPRQGFLEGLERMRQDGTITDAKSAPSPETPDRTVIAITTPPLTCTRDTDGAKFDVGRFEVLVDFLDGTVRFRNLDRPHPYFVHPHVEAGGRACLGNAAEAISEMIARLEIVALIGLLIDFLSNANGADSWGATVAQWPKVAEGDGTPVSPPAPEVDPDEANDDEYDRDEDDRDEGDPDED